MSQGLIYGSNVALEVVKMAARDCHKDGLDKGILGWSIFPGFVYSSSHLADVFYAHDGTIRRPAGIGFVDYPGVYVYAIDSGVHVRRWAFVDVDSEVNGVEFTQRFANIVSGKHGKVCVSDIFPGDKNGLFSVSFPMVDNAVFSKSVPYCSDSFQKSLDTVLAEVRRNCISAKHSL